MLRKDSWWLETGPHVRVIWGMAKPRQEAVPVERRGLQDGGELTVFADRGEAHGEGRSKGGEWGAVRSVGKGPGAQAEE